MGIEILEQVRNVDAIIVPVGGCGLIAGVSMAVKTLSPRTQVNLYLPSIKYLLVYGVIATGDGRWWV